MAAEREMTWRRRSRGKSRCSGGSVGSGAVGFLLVAMCSICLLLLPVSTTASKGLPASMGARHASLSSNGDKRRKEKIKETAKRFSGGTSSARDFTRQRSRVTSSSPSVDTSDSEESDGYESYDDADDEWDDNWSEEDSWGGSGDAVGTGGRVKGTSEWGRRSGAGAQMLKEGSQVSGLRERLNRARRRASEAYREAKSLMSSEMEGVVLKATRPDDLPVKPKHLEALMRPATEMPKEFNVYLPVVKKLWAKMTDKEWRVVTKALYIVHRFAADGSSEHAPNLRQSMVVLRNHHDSRRKVKYFDMQTICDVKPPPWSDEDVAPFSEFLKVYADFVLQRTTQFGPRFGEVMDDYAMLIREGEMLSAVSALVSAGRKCVLTREQESAVPVAAAVQVAHDMRDIMEVCAAQLDFLVRKGQARGIYPAEVDLWYKFFYDNYEHVAALTHWANELAARHDISTTLRPLVATSIVLEMRNEEVAKLKAEAAEQAEQQEQCAVEDADEELATKPADVPVSAACRSTDQITAGIGRPHARAETKSSAPARALHDASLPEKRAMAHDAGSTASRTPSSTSPSSGSSSRSTSASDRSKGGTASVKSKERVTEEAIDHLPSEVTSAAPASVETGVAGAARRAKSAVAKKSRSSMAASAELKRKAGKAKTKTKTPPIVSATSSTKLTHGGSSNVKKTAKPLPEAGKRGGDGHRKRSRTSSASGKPSSGHADDVRVADKAGNIAGMDPHRAHPPTKAPSRVSSGAETEEGREIRSSSSREHRKSDSNTEPQTSKSRRRTMPERESGFGAVVQHGGEGSLLSAANSASGKSRGRGSATGKGATSDNFSSENKNR